MLMMKDEIALKASKISPKIVHIDDLNTNIYTYIYKKILLYGCLEAILKVTFSVLIIQYRKIKGELYGFLMLIYVDILNPIFPRVLKSLSFGLFSVFSSGIFTNNIMRRHNQQVCFPISYISSVSRGFGSIVSSLLLAYITPQ